MNYFYKGSDFIGGVNERINLHISTTEITVPIAGGSLTLNIAKNDRQAAWNIYTQLSTRVAAVEFDESFDSAYLVHQSLYKMFDLIREEISKIPVERVRGDKSDNTVVFYMDILNKGIRPHLSKWHLPLEAFVKTEREKHPNESYFEIEKKFPLRKELIESLKAMNIRMNGYSKSLLMIAKGAK